MANVLADKAAFDVTAKKRADLFIKNFGAYEGGSERRSQSRRTGFIRMSIAR
jgi:hypothetical protein